MSEQYAPGSIIESRQASTAGAASSGSASVAVLAKGDVIITELVETGERPD